MTYFNTLFNLSHKTTWGATFGPRALSLTRALELTVFIYLFSSLSGNSDGLAAFRAFLRTEFSEENLEFWLACEDYKKIKLQSKMVSKSKKIFAEYIAIQSCKEVSMGNKLVPDIKSRTEANRYFVPASDVVL